MNARAGYGLGEEIHDKGKKKLQTMNGVAQSSNNQITILTKCKLPVGKSIETESSTRGQTQKLGSGFRYSRRLGFGTSEWIHLHTQNRAVDKTAARHRNSAHDAVNIVWAR